MAAVLILVALLALVIVINYATPAIREWLRCRDVVRRSALDQQMQAMRAAQQLSLMAWMARRQMQGLAEEIRTPRPPETSRVTRTRYFK